MTVTPAMKKVMLAIQASPRGFLSPRSVGATDRTWGALHKLGLIRWVGRYPSEAASLTLKGQEYLEGTPNPLVAYQGGTAGSFVYEHPYLTFFLGLFTLSAVVTIVRG
jgi:hypothetical protein